mgnify:CR=1 FL=1
MSDLILVGSWITLQTLEGIVIPESHMDPFIRSVRKYSPETSVAIIEEKTGFRQGQEYGAERVRCLLNLLPELDADHIILTDLRDVLVQQNLQGFPSHVLGFHLEARGRMIKDCEYNAPWIKNFYGNEMLRQIGDKPISNVSMVSGPKDKVIEYVRNLDAIMQKAAPAPQVEKASAYRAEMERAWRRIAGVNAVSIVGTTVQIGFTDYKPLPEVKSLARQVAGNAAYFLRTNNQPVRVKVKISLRGHESYELDYESNKGVVEEQEF